MTSESWIFTKASWTEKNSFLVENRDGSQATLEIRGPKSHKNSFAPVEMFLASISSCAGINLVMLLEERGVTPDTCIVKAECLLNHTAPRLIEKIHLVFHVAVDLGEMETKSEIERAMTLVCPIAVTVGKATDVTWETIFTRTQNSG